MGRWTISALLWVGTLLGAPPEDPPDDLLDRIKARMKENLAQVPDYICLQTVERWSRPSPDAQFELLDTLKLEVGFVGDKEIFAWHGARKFEDKELAEMVGSGVVGTGGFAIHASNVFLSSAPHYTSKGEAILNGRRTIHYEYEVPQELSRYRIRVPPYQAVVGFHGAFWVDAQTLDLVRLEVHADDIPEELQLARTSDAMEYSRVGIGSKEFLLPSSSELTMVGIRGYENRNRRLLGGCKQFVAETKIAFEESAGSLRAGKESAGLGLPPNLSLDLSLVSEINLERAAVGDPVQAVLVRPLADGDQVFADKGAVLLGRLVRLEKYKHPIPYFVVGIQFHTLARGSEQAEISATMEHVEQASGLIRQAKHMNPTFSRRRSPGLQLLVEERQKGLGVLHWEAKQPRLPRGLRMRWRTDPPERR